MDKKVELVNVVGNGDLNHELDLEVLQENINHFKYVQSRGNTIERLTIEFDDEVGTISVFRTGNYNLMGSNSVKNLNNLNGAFIRTLSELGIIDSIDTIEISIVNYVFSVNMDTNIDIHELNSKLGTNAEYEPEQNPFIIYRPDHIDCTVTISNSGKCVINTPVGEDAVHQFLEHISDYLKDE